MNAHPCFLVSFVFVVCLKLSDLFISILLHNIKIFISCLNFEQVKFWTLINLMNNIVIVLVCAKCSKLITSQENTISVQQLPLSLPLFFVFSSEVLKSDIKSCFDGVSFSRCSYEVIACVLLYFCFKGNFFVLYCGKDCKNVIRGKKCLQSRFFSVFASSLLKYEKFCKFGA